MSLTLTIAGDDRSISAVGKDSLGSYTAEGAVTVGNEDRAAGTASLRDAIVIAEFVDVCVCLCVCVCVCV
jgi:hypothetical protein